MISSPGCQCLPKATPGASSTRTWMTSRPGALRSCRWRSVRLIPPCCACATYSARLPPTISATTTIIRIVFMWTPLIGGCVTTVGGRRAINARRPPPDAALPQRFERRAQLRREQLRILPHCEVPAPVDLVEVQQLGEGATGPGLLGANDLVREHRDGHRDLDFGGLLIARTHQAPSAVLPVDSRRRAGGVRQPVQ